MAVGFNGQLDFTIQTDAGELRVRGLKKTLSQLRKLGVSASDIRGVTKPAAERVAARARRLAPVGETGRLKKSIRGLGARTRVRVAAGRPSMPDYAGVQEWGWPKRHIKERSFMRDARDAELPVVKEMLERGIIGLAQKHGFKIK